MTDHELCLLAAKAAGYTVEVGIPDNPWLLRTGDDGITYWWNPLAQGDQTFDLMVDCGIDVEFENHAVVATSYCGREWIATDYRELFDTDKHAATMRVIVRAAAAMGEDR